MITLSNEKATKKSDYECSVVARRKKQDGRVANKSDEAVQRVISMAGIVYLKGRHRFSPISNVDFR